MAGLARHRGVECEALALLRSDTDDDDLKDQVAQAVRILADRAAGRSVDAGPAGIASYASYVERLVGVPPWTAEARASLKTAVAATLRCVRERARVTPHELEDLLMRHQCNLYGVTGRAGEDKASASFVGFLHLFNHACCPNVVFDSARPAQPATAEAGPLFALRALTDVAEGAELCISYTSSAEGPVARAAHLEEWYSYPYQHNIYPIRIRVSRVDVMLALLSVMRTNRYGFKCLCARCQCDDPLEELDYDDALDALRCAHDRRMRHRGLAAGASGVPCEVGHAARRCVHCGGSWEDEEE